MNWNWLNQPVVDIRLPEIRVPRWNWNWIVSLPFFAAGFPIGVIITAFLMVQAHSVGVALWKTTVGTTWTMGGINPVGAILAGVPLWYIGWGGLFEVPFRKVALPLFFGKPVMPPVDPPIFEPRYDGWTWKNGWNWEVRWIMTHKEYEVREITLDPEPFDVLTSDRIPAKLDLSVQIRTYAVYAIIDIADVPKALLQLIHMAARAFANSKSAEELPSCKEPLSEHLVNGETVDTTRGFSYKDLFKRLGSVVVAASVTDIPMDKKWLTQKEAEARELIQARSEMTATMNLAAKMEVLGGHGVRGMDAARVALADAGTAKMIIIDTPGGNPLTAPAAIVAGLGGTPVVRSAPAPAAREKEEEEDGEEES